MRHLIALMESHCILEGREGAIRAKFIPLLKKRCETLSHNDFNAAKQIIADLSTRPPRWMYMYPLNIANDPKSEERLEFFADAILRLIWKNDPDPRKQYTTWMLNTFIKGNLELEDIERTAGYLDIFTKVKARLPIELRDINRIQSTVDLFNIVKDYREKKGEIVNDSYERKMYAQSELIYSGADYEILSPKTKDASCYFGRGTEWCTAYAPPKTNNQFDYYNQSGKLYIVTDRSTGTKWQFHFGNVGSREFRDSDDNKISIRDFVQDHPKVKEIFDSYLKSAESWEKIKTSYYIPTIAYFMKRTTSGFLIGHHDRNWESGGFLSKPMEHYIEINQNNQIEKTILYKMTVDEDFIEILNQLGVKGFTKDAWFIEEDFIKQGIFWSGKKFCSFVDLPVLEKQQTCELREHDGVSKKTFYITKVANNVVVDDLFNITIKNTDIEFRVRSHTNFESEAENNFLVDVLLKYIDQNMSVDWHNSDMPRTPKLAQNRPQWTDAKYLLELYGPTSYLAKRVARRLMCQSDGENVEMNLTVYDLLGAISDEFRDFNLKEDFVERFSTTEPDLYYELSEYMRSNRKNVKRLHALNIRDFLYAGFITTDVKNALNRYTSHLAKTVVSFAEGITVTENGKPWNGDDVDLTVSIPVERVIKSLPDNDPIETSYANVREIVQRSITVRNKGVAKAYEKALADFTAEIKKIVYA